MPYSETTEFDLIAIISAMFGESYAITVALEFGGTNIEFPLHFKADNPLLAFIGEDRANLLLPEVGGARFYIRKGLATEARRRRALEMIDEGATVSVAARATGFSERNIYNLTSARRRKRREAMQP